MACVLTCFYTFARKDLLALADYDINIDKGMALIFLMSASAGDISLQDVAVSWLPDDTIASQGNIGESSD